MHDNIWQDALATFRSELSAHDYNTWFKPMNCRREGDDEFVLEVPHAFFAQWIRDRYLESIESTLGKLTESDVQVCFELTGPPSLDPSGKSVRSNRPPTAMELPLEPRRAHAT